MMRNDSSLHERVSNTRNQWAVGRPNKACSQCKTQKVRCSGDRPTCSRCLRLGHTCAYQINHAQRPTRAPRHRQSVVTSAHPPSPSASTQQWRDSPTGEFCSGLINTPGVVAFSMPPGLSDNTYHGIPSTLVLTLIDVYYTHVYNASLLLHKPSFLKAVAAGSTRKHVLLSVCAWAANFYRDTHGQTTLKDHGFMMEWANRAGALVFQEAETPHEENLVTFMNLALLFYSHGLWRRSYIHKGNATLVALSLGLGNENHGKEQLLETEVRRRRFWACYLIGAHASEGNYFAVAEPSSSILKLTLPWREEDFTIGIPSQPRTCLESNQSNGGLFSELIRAMMLWSAVSSLIKKPPTTMESRISAINTMDNRMSEWWRGLPVCLHLTPSSIPNVSPVVLPKLLLIHIVYHECLIALHASIVPVFSWIPGDESWLTARQTSAQLAFDHACAVSDLFEGVLAHFPMLSMLPSFVAYAAYCGCAVQIPFMWSTDKHTKEMVHKNVKNNLKIIKALSQYWKYTSLLQIYIEHLYRTHTKNTTPLEKQPKHIDSVELTGSKFNALIASTTILGFNRILWSKSGTCAEVGEEITDLGMDDDDESEVRIIEDEAVDHDLQPRGQDPSSFNSSSSLQSSSWDRFQPELYTEFQEYPEIDGFRPLDPTMWGVDGSLFDTVPSSAPLDSSFIVT